MKVRKLFRKTRFGLFALFGLVVLSMSALSIWTVDTQISAEYELNGQNVVKAIADSSVDILLNRNLATLQSLIDQFVEIPGIRYIYVTDETGEFLAHTFVPGIPDAIRRSDPSRIAPIERNLPGMGDFLEVGHPILAGAAGTVHLGMDLDRVALKIQWAIGQQVYLLSLLLVGGTLVSIRLIDLAAKPLAELLAHAAELARGRSPEEAPDEKLLARDDEIGQLARLMLHLSRNPPEAEEPPERPGGTSSEADGE